jgi:parvulin-like peptidyl-prolyl isomerase
MRAHFSEHKDEYDRPERAQAQHILVAPTEKTDAGREAARKKLDEIRTRVKAGAGFSDEAAAHSDCPSGRSAGGSLGWFGRGMMVPAFDQAVFSMQVGELSEVIETSFGYHIIQKTGHEAATPAEYDEVRDSVRDFLFHAARGEALSAYVSELKTRAKIKMG